MQEPRHRRDNAANYLREAWGIPCSAGHLANLASRKSGPKYILFGRFPLYLQSELDRWAQSRISQPNSSSAPPLGRETSNLMKGA